MDYYGAYKELVSYAPKQLIMYVLEYIFVKCADCNDSYVEEYYECNCGTKRCKHHAYINTRFYKTIVLCYKKCRKSVSNTNVSLSYPDIACIICGHSAYYGYKDLVCYCYTHTKFAKITYSYGQISIMNEMSLYDEKGEPCSFCNKKCLNMKTCLCKKYCSYCFVIHCWKKEDDYVCNDCKMKTEGAEYSVVDSGILCHKLDCIIPAVFTNNFTLLWCSNHRSNLSNVSIFRTCVVDNCKKIRIYKDRCYDHVSEKVKKWIKYMVQ